MARKQSKTDCTFCKIISGEIPSKIAYKDKDVVVFPDINPATPVHLLIVPVKHIESLSDVTDADTPVLGKMLSVASRMAKEQGLSQKGYRLTINNGADAGQIVPHLHMHLLGGRPLNWDN